MKERNIDWTAWMNKLEAALWGLKLAASIGLMILFVYLDLALRTTVGVKAWMDVLMRSEMAVHVLSLTAELWFYTFNVALIAWSVCGLRRACRKNSRRRDPLKAVMTWADFQEALKERDADWAARE